MNNILLKATGIVICISSICIAGSADSAEAKIVEQYQDSIRIIQAYNDPCYYSANATIIKELGSFHKTMGTLNIIDGGASILTMLIYAAIEKDVWAMPTTYLIIISGGVSLGLGTWELNIGWKMQCFKDN